MGRYVVDVYSLALVFGGAVAQTFRLLIVIVWWLPLPSVVAGLLDAGCHLAPLRCPTFVFVVVLLLGSSTPALCAPGDGSSLASYLRSQSLSSLDRSTFSRAAKKNAQERYYHDGTPMSIEDLDREVWFV